MTTLALHHRSPLAWILVVGASLIASAMVLFLGYPSLVVVLTVGLLLLFAKAAWCVPVFLLSVCILQPMVLRVTPPDTLFHLGVKRADEFSLAVLLPAALITLWIQKRSPLPKLTIAGLSVVTAIGLASSWIQGTGVKLILLDAFLLFKGFAFFIVVLACRVDPGGAKRLIRFTLAVGVLAAAIGLLEIVAPGLVRGLLPLEREGMRMGRVALISIFDNEGQAASFFALLATFTYAGYLTYRRQGLLGLFLLFSLCAVLTLRRKPVGGLAVVLLLALVLVRGTSQRTKGVVVLAGLLAGFVVAFGDTFLTVFAQGYEIYVASRDPTRVARNAMYIASFRIAVDHFPLGVGFGLFGGYATKLHYSKIYYQYGLSNIWGLSSETGQFLLDTFWPHVLGQFGFIGTGGFVAGMAGIWRPLVTVARRTGPALSTALALGALFAVAEALIPYRRRPEGSASRRRRAASRP